MDFFTAMDSGPHHHSLAKFGFKFGKSSSHLARTLMLSELRLLLAFVDQADVGPANYRSAICDQNCLGKRSGQTRSLTYQHLVDLYALDPGKVIFRYLRSLWVRDPGAQPLLALLCAYARDPILRRSAGWVLPLQETTALPREAVEDNLEEIYPDRFSPATRKSTAQNLNSTWTQSGHLTGRVKKVRTRTHSSAGAVAYALLVGYLTGVRGPALFETEFARILDCPVDRVREQAEEAAQRGFLVCKRIGEVIEIAFPNLLTQEEQEWLREPS